MPFRRASIFVRVTCSATLLFATLATNANAATLAQDTADWLEKIRAVRVSEDEALIAKFNSDMDGAWKFFLANRAAVLPLLRAELKSEIAKPAPNQMLLLDIGYFVLQQDDPLGQPLALDALFRIDPSQPVIQWNIKQLFEFAHGAARKRDPRVLPLIAKTFLVAEHRVFIPQHHLTLDPTLICVFLYGAYGPDAEAAVSAQLTSKAATTRALEILVWLGTPASVRSVGDTLLVSPDLETTQRVTAYMMQAAGPAGREYMLSLDTSALDVGAREYISKVRAAIESTTFEKYRTSFVRLPGDAKLADDRELRGR